eukprot:2642078-Prymnesium_polylepis.2
MLRWITTSASSSSTLVAGSVHIQSFKNGVSQPSAVFGVDRRRRPRESCRRTESRKIQVDASLRLTLESGSRKLKLYEANCRLNSCTSGEKGTTCTLSYAARITSSSSLRNANSAERSSSRTKSGHRDPSWCNRVAMHSTPGK